VKNFSQIFKGLAIYIYKGIMESTDLKEVLKGREITLEETSEIKNADKHILHKKTHEDDISEALDALNCDTEIEMETSMYDKDWTKLEKGMKLNRLKKFVESEKEEKGLNDKCSESLENLLFKMCNEGQFNKANIVEYENEKIISIKILEYDEDSKTYRGKKQKKKIRTTPKSKSNLDRLFKKK
jgi:hypothetical protein